MTVRRFIKQWMPPVLLEWYRSSKEGGQYRGPIWDGIYQHHREVPASGEGFDGEVWIDGTYAYTEATLTNNIPASAGGYALLPLLASVVRNSSGRVTILDFGGGMGIGYVHLKGSLPHHGAVQYYVVEGKGVCTAGAKLFGNDTQIHFCDALPENLDNVDIVYVRSALQYVEDFKGAIGRLAAYRPRFFLFVDLMAGENVTYATAQRNVRGSVIAHWFINTQEILDLMTGLGYALIFRGLQDREFDQSNFPKPYRLGRACNLLFARAAPTDG